jgi:CO dehydrogenase maturation factor
VSPEQLLGQLASPGRTVVADLEAGVGTLTRMPAGSLDLLVVIAEPTAKSLDVALRVAAVAAERGIGPVRFVGNKLDQPGDVHWVRKTLGAEVVPVPTDLAIAGADRDGLAPLDVAPDSPGVTVLVEFARTLNPAGAGGSKGR